MHSDTHPVLVRDARHYAPLQTACVRACTRGMEGGLEGAAPVLLLQLLLTHLLQLLFLQLLLPFLLLPSSSSSASSSSRYSSARGDPHLSDHSSLQAWNPLATTSSCVRLGLCTWQDTVLQCIVP